MFFRNRCLVVYSWTKERKGEREQGTGSVEITFFGIMNFDKIRKIRKEIAENCEFKDVIITNIIKL